MRATASRCPPFQSRVSNRTGARRVMARNSALYSAKAPAIRRAASGTASVKIGRQLRMEVMLVEPLDLRGESSARGKLRQSRDGEELNGISLAAHRGRAAGTLAEEEQLEDVVKPGRMRMKALVEERRELHRPRAVARFFEDLPHDGLRGRVVDVDPAARQCPFAIGALSDEEDSIPLEDPAAHIHLRRHVPFIAAPEHLRLLEGDLQLRGEQSGDEVGELSEALTVERVPGEGEPVLGDRLHLAGPIEQCRGHMLRISASPKADVETSLAPSISRAKSYVTVFWPIVLSIARMTASAASTQPM